MPGRRSLLRVAVSIAAVLFVIDVTYSQQDTLRSPIPDTLRKSTADTLALPQDTIRQTGDIDTTIFYSGKDSVIYSMGRRTMYIHGNGDLQYETMGLKSAVIEVNWDTSTLTAIGVVDTADSTGKKRIGNPILTDAGDTYDGDRVTYNFKSQKGRITLGATQMDNGYYRGSKIKKVGKDALFIENGIFTTCDNPDPHFHFGSPKLKVYLRDHIVAEPVFLYVADVPVFALPFGIFPNESGRRSGIIAPAYGQDARRGRYISRFGYYWAMNDYMDIATTFDWYARGGWLNRSLFRYNLRYEFSGSISASTASLFEGAKGDPGRSESRDYNINWMHSQSFNPTTSLSVNFTWMSGTFYRKFSTNLEDILRQNIISTATLNKTFEDLNSSLSLTIYRDQNLVTGDINEQLPSISYRQSQIYPFKKKTRSRGVGGSSEPAEQSWYELIGINYNVRGLNQRTLTHSTISSVVDPTVDSIRLSNDQSRYGVHHQLNTGISPKIGYFNVSPFINYEEKWYAKSIERDSTGTRDVNGFRAVRTFSTGVSASTRLFGIWQPDMFGVTGVRHTLTPAVTYSYMPDFANPSYGYYGEYVDTSGKMVKYNKFEREVFGGAPAGELQLISLSLGNVFEAKYRADDTSGREEKVQLMNAGLSLSYNIAADSMNLSPLSVSYRTDVGSLLSINASTMYNFYRFDTLGGRRVNDYILSGGKKLADLTSFSLSFSTSLAGKKKSEAAKRGPSPAEAIAPGQIATPQQMVYQNLYSQQEPDFDIPWNLSLSYTFSQSQEDPRRKFISSTMNANLSFSLTDKWQINATGGYDFRRKEVTAPSISVNRDLHCWVMTFNWYPIGFYKGYRLEIKVKAPQLQDLKITKQGSQRPTYY